MAEQSVYTLVVRVGRKAGDGLPDGGTGAELLCYASGRDEAVREVTALLHRADMAPLDVTGYGSEGERAVDGPLDEGERSAMECAALENAVVVADIRPFFDPPE